MKKNLLLAGLLFITVPAFCCTTFFINKDGQLLFGRNYDWVTRNGMVCTNLKGLKKTSAPREDGKTITWTSQYGSITFNQYGKEFPTGGINEKGLVIELMWLDGTQYPSADERPSVGVLQWIQYHLDKCSTVDELIAEDRNIRISTAGTTPLHYLVADANGNAATIEFFKGKMTVHKGSTLPLAVLTNDRYDESVEQANKILKRANDNYYFSTNSIDRFAKTCQLVNQFESSKSRSPIDYSFSILDQVAQGNTKWSIVYDIKKRSIHFKSLQFRDVKEISFDSFNFSCDSQSKTWDINQPGKGNISHQFLNFSIDTNRKLVNRSFDESRTEFTVSEKGRAETGNYPATISCL